MTVIAAAVVPAAPVLIPALTGRTPAAAEVREAALGSITDMLATGPIVVVIAAETPTAGWFDSSNPLGLGRVGGQESAEPDLPLSLAIGLQVLRDAGWQGEIRLLGLESGVAVKDIALPDNSALLLMANGSARCTEKAPGSLDPGAEAFNAFLVTALQLGKSEQLASIPGDDAHQQWSDAVGPLALLAQSIQPLPKATLRFAGEWGGVYYICGSLLPANLEMT